MTKMKTRGSWVKVSKFVGVIGLVCGLLMAATFRDVRKRSPRTETGLSQLAASQVPKISATKGDSKWSEAYGKLPLSFEENQGQTSREVRYVSHGSGYELFLTPQEAVLALRPAGPRALSPLRRPALHRAAREANSPWQTTAIRLELKGANPNPQISGTGRLPAKVNYFIGNDPEKWHTDVPSYARVKYAGVYPGVDLVFYGNQRRLEYDFIVAPGADPKAIAFKVDGTRKMRVNPRGDLVLSLAGSEVELRKPVVYQNVKGEKREIACRYAIGSDHRVTFAVADYDRSEPLVLDPVLNYSTYLGGSVDDGGAAIAVDGSGNAFIAGISSSLDFPPGTKGTGGTAPAGNLGVSFVAELDPTGTKLLYSGYLAGTNSNVNEQAWGIAVDSAGKVYVTGQTYSTDFPTTSVGFKQSPNPTNVNGTSYLVKLDPTVNGSGSLLYSTYIGGTNGTASGLVGDIGQAVAVDTTGVAYVAGYTDSTPSTTVTSQLNFPVVNGFQTTLKSAEGNAFLAKIDTTKSGTASLLYSTYLGGTATNSATRLGFGDVAYGVAIDAASGNAYLAGVTPSTDFPTTVTGLQQPNSPPGNTQGTAFVTQIDTTKPVATQLVYSTYLGGSAFEEAKAIALGPNKVAYVTGTTESNNFPTTPGAFDTSTASFGKAFVTLIDTAAAGGGAATKKYSTYLGGTGGNTGFGIQADAAGNAYVAGSTGPNNFPFPPKSSGVGGFEPTYPAGAPNAGFIAKLNPAGGGMSDLLYSTYFGGVGGLSGGILFGDQIRAIAIDTTIPPNVYVTGQTFSTNATFPVFPATAFQTALKPPSDAFVAKLALIPTLSILPAPGTTIDFGTVQTGHTSAPPQTVTLTNNTSGNIAFTSAVLSGTNAADYAVSTAGCSPNIVVGTPCVVSLTFTPTVLAPPSEVATLTITDGDSTSPQVFNLTGKGSATPPPPDFTLSAAPTALNVAQGAVGAPVTISVNPTNGFASAVALTCTGAPANSSCVLSPASITPPTTSALTFTAHAMLVPLPISKPAPPLNYLRIVPLFLALMLIFLLRSTQRFRTRLATVLAIVICITLAACSGPTGPAKTAKGVYPLTVKGTSGALSHNTTVTITVN
jgi:hypothetical protein